MQNNFSSNSRQPGPLMQGQKSLFVQLPVEKRFRLTNGVEINNLLELYEEVQVMQDYTYYTHVRNNRNDFAQWVKETLGEGRIASRLYSATDKEEFIFILAEEIKHLEDKNYRTKPETSSDSFYHVEKRMHEHEQKVNKSNEHNNQILQKLYELTQDMSTRMQHMERRVYEVSHKVDKVQEETRKSIVSLSEGMKKRYKDLQNELHELENLEREVEWRKRHVDIMEKGLKGDK